MIKLQVGSLCGQRERDRETGVGRKACRSALEEKRMAGE